MQCKYCNKSTPNPSFCSKSCAASFNNKAYPKKKLTRQCVECTNIVKSYRHTRCQAHWQAHKETKWENKTIGEYRNRLSIVGKHKSWRHAHIRLAAKKYLREAAKKACEVCGYDKHVEVAHIVPIYSFPDNALIREVNHKNNLKLLCPNCHWEFDNR